MATDNAQRRCRVCSRAVATTLARPIHRRVTRWVGGGRIRPRRLFPNHHYRHHAFAGCGKHHQRTTQLEGRNADSSRGRNVSLPERGHESRWNVEISRTSPSRIWRNEPTRPFTARLYRNQLSARLDRRGKPSRTHAALGRMATAHLRVHGSWRDRLLDGELVFSRDALRWDGVADRILSKSRPRLAEQLAILWRSIITRRIAYAGSDFLLRSRRYGPSSTRIRLRGAHRRELGLFNRRHLLRAARE